MDEIRCPKCHSTECRCYHESTEWFRDMEGELYEAPVGLMVCKLCGHPFEHDDEPNSERVTYGGVEL